MRSSKNYSDQMMTKRINYSSGAVWEEIVGYSRAVKAGNIIEISGTTAVDETGEIRGLNNPYEQSRFILEKIAKVLSQAGASLNDVVRTRIYVTDINNWKEIAKAHSEFFKDIKPAATMVQVVSLIDKRMLVEIEVSAIILS